MIAKWFSFQVEIFMERMKFLLKTCENEVFSTKYINTKVETPSERDGEM